jgi:hypothetical protein
VGDVTGGLAMGVKNFWQSYPASLEVQGTTKAAANVASPQPCIFFWAREGYSFSRLHVTVTSPAC